MVYTEWKLSKGYRIRSLYPLKRGKNPTKVGVLGKIYISIWWWSSSSGDLVSVVWFGLVWFYGISTIEGYLMPNQFVNI